MSQTDDDFTNIDDIPDDEEVEVEITKVEEEEEEVEEEEVEEEQEPTIYDSDDFISEALISENCTLPYNILDFDFSYGYNCRKYYNLTVIDENTLIFVSGNIINFLDVNTKEIWFRRSALGGGIGHITKNPNLEYPHFAVAESGQNPIIIIYEWPSLDINCVLHGGSTRIYTHVDYSPDGKLLVSQAGEPDYLITVWDWTKRKIQLRTKSYVNDVHNVMFSPFVPGQLVSSGISHIKFWKMATTFTGLKLKGEMGRYGKTEYSDILGLLPMPDETVVSGCSWGNILVWEDGLIKLEVLRSARKKCHEAPIVQFYYSDGELWSVSMDGHVKVWWYENIEQADPSDEDRVLMLDPNGDFYTPGMMLMSIQPRYQILHNSAYFAQDGNGGIWLLDINSEEDCQPAQQLYKCHAGEVMDIVACPFGPYFLSLGAGGRINLYDYMERKLVFQHHFPAKGTCLIWLPMKFQSTGDQLLASFDDGLIRAFILNIGPTIKIRVVQTTKAHSKPITLMSINSNGSLLISAGEDSTIFVYQLIKSPLMCTLVPIGFIPSPELVTCIEWHPEKLDQVMLGCLRGQMMEVQVPSEPQSYTDVSYLLQVEPVYNHFTSYKAQIRRDIKILEIAAKKEARLQKKREEMLKVIADNPGLTIDEDIFLEDSESEEVLEPLHIPEVPNKIIWLKYTDKNTIWLNMAGYDAGYIYEYDTNEFTEIPLRFKMICDADDMEISYYLYNHNKKYLIFAMQDGSIRINRVSLKDFTDLSDYWSISMHDNVNGFIPKMTFSYDEKFLFTCGYDGSIFANRFQPREHYILQTEIPTERSKFPDAVGDGASYHKLSLEETKTKAEQNRILQLANGRKAVLREKLAALKTRYLKLLQQNSKLLSSQVIPRDELELDERVREYIDKQFSDKLDLVKRKLAYDVERSEIAMLKLKKYMTDPLDMFPITVKGINSDVYIDSVRQRTISPKIKLLQEIVEQKLIELELQGRPADRSRPPRKSIVPKPERKTMLEYFLMSLSTAVIQDGLGRRLSRTLGKYRHRRAKWEKRTEEWDEFMLTKPLPGENHKEDEINYSEAELTIGDYKLKTAEDFKVTFEQRENIVKKYKHLLEIRKKQFVIRHELSAKIYSIRAEKVELLKFLTDKLNEVADIHKELPECVRKYPPPVPEVDTNEFPERHIEVKVEMPTEEVSEEDVDVVTEQLFIHPLTYNQLEKQMLSEIATYNTLDSNNYFLCPLATNASKSVADMDLDGLFLISVNDKKPTIYEEELRTIRLNKKTFEQRFLINVMIEKTRLFNHKIETLVDQRVENLVKGNYIDLFILTMHQELKILKSCEDRESQLTKDMVEKANNLLDMQNIVKELKANIEIINSEIEDRQNEGTRVYEKFIQSTQDNKFFDFFKKVFRRKFRPPKVKNTGDESSSSSSSSSSSDESDDDDDAGSIDSRDFGIIKQDLNVCPKGCDPTLFDLTIQYRTNRHEVEQIIRDALKEVESLKKELEYNSKKLVNTENLLKASHEELENFQLEKQKRLNEIHCTVILKLSQIQKLTNDGNVITNVKDVLVFSRSKLTKLYHRVGELQGETFEQHSRHEVYVKHLAHMNRDIKYMQKKLMGLRKAIVTLTIEKFGNVIDINDLELAILQRKFKATKINDLEEVVMKKMVYDLRMRLGDVKDLFAKEIQLWMKKVWHQQKEVSEVLRENTRRLELLSIIKQEKADIVESMANLPAKKEQLRKIEENHKEYLQGLKKLENIIEDQYRYMQELKDEITMLKTKGMPPKPVRGPCKFAQQQELNEMEEVVKDWVDYDQYISLGEIGEEEEETQPSLTEFFPTEAEDIVSDLLTEMLAEMDADLTKKSAEELLRNILSGCCHCSSIMEIINEIINNLPFDPNEEQRRLIEQAAEKLLQIQEPDLTPEEVDDCVKQLLEDTIDDVLFEMGEPHEVMANLVEKLVEFLPVEYVKRKASIDLIVRKLLDSSINFALDEKELMRSVTSSGSLRKDSMIEVLRLILEEVYGTGIDFLYYI